MTTELKRTLEEGGVSLSALQLRDVFRNLNLNTDGLQQGANH